MAHGRLRALVMPRGRLRMLAVPLLALLSVMLVATPARAHDVLVASDPKDGAVLGAMPASVTLTFDQAVRRDFARIAVTGPDGAHFEQGEITVDGRNVSIGVRTGTPAGAYAIGYRIVSNDGHPVTGAVKFTVTGGGAAPGAVTAPTVTPATGTATTGAGTTGQGGGSWVWGLLVVTAALLALCARVLVRHDRRLRDGAIPAPAAAGTPRAASPGAPDPSGTDHSGADHSGADHLGADHLGAEPSATEAPETESSGAPASEAEAAGTSNADSGAEDTATGRSTAAGTGAGSSPASGGAA
ncbi:Copper-binding protein CopC (methionine-rich) [Microbispora rosea]|uniref:Copper-binding protein CopC (Methionine-rich) n=1 Tax=Microbispora rosea TaxID=58117 RepID=A0A1N6Z7B5_9ACTN|nr:copper resistance CopC family protein [Microbispora rosea]SIR22679.1 Copper-binding protein CopC (methionine-rich) [Microbispora rosea]